jgi:hypothetical protein
MSEDAIKLLTKEAFQQDAEAEGKWKRELPYRKCNYVLIFWLEIFDFREQLKGNKEIH